MKTQNIIDITELVLQRGMDVCEIEMLDYDFSIGMGVRMVFFLFSICLRDLNTYTWDELWFQIAAWAIFHFFIVFIEFHYLLKGQSKTADRELFYNWFDLIQSIIGLIYSSYHQESTFDKCLFILFTLNSSIDVILLILKIWHEKKSKDYIEPGGTKGFFVGLFVGTLTVNCYLLIIMRKYEQEIEESNLIKGYLIITLIGEIAGCLFSFCLCLTPSSKMYPEVKKFSKGLLAFTYGLNFGLYSIFYGYLIGLLIIIGLIYLCCTCREESEYVHPTS